MQVTRRRRVVRGLAAALAAATALALAAGCSSGSSGSGSTTGSSSAPKASGTLGALQSQGSATVGIVNQLPFSGVSATGATTGFSPALAQQILSDLGVSHMKAVVGGYGDMIPGLDAGRWNFVAASLVVTPARCQQVIFSDPIISDYVRVAYTSGSAPTTLAQIIASKEKVGILTGSTYIAQFEKLGMPASQLVQLTDVRSGLSAVQAGRVAVFAGSASGFDIQGIDPSIRLSPRLSDIPRSVSAFAFKKSDTALRDAVDTDLKKLESNGEYVKLAKQWGFTGTEIDGLSTNQACQASS